MQYGMACYLRLRASTRGEKPLVLLGFSLPNAAFFLSRPVNRDLDISKLVVGIALEFDNLIAAVFCDFLEISDERSEQCCGSWCGCGRS